MCRLYAYAILHEGLQHPWILVLMAGGGRRPGTNPMRILREDCIYLEI
jgi:hypothetical protein